MTYPLETSTFSKRYLIAIQSKAVHLMAPKCGINQKSKLALLYGPANYGGYGFLHLWAEQGLLMTQMFLKYWRYNNQIGKLLRTTYKWAQIHAGISFSILKNTDTPLPHLESKWFHCIGHFCTRLKAKSSLMMILMCNPNATETSSLWKPHSTPGPLQTEK